MKEFTLQTGKEVLLKTQPVDPRDLFRGDYVILNYDISTLNLGSVDTDTTNFNPDEKVFVKLDIKNKYGTATGIYKKAPKGLYIKGSVMKVENSMITVGYGIESYFVPEGEGKVIERRRSGELDVKVSIDEFGNSGIKALLIDGKEVDFK